MAKSYKAPIPFIEAHHKGGKQKPTAIVLRLSYTTSEKGAALGLANYFHSISAPLDPSHYTVDEAMVYRCVPDRIECQHSGKLSKNSISIRMCAELTEQVYDWRQKERDLVLNRAANLVSDLAHEYKIHLRYLSDKDIARWMKRRNRSRGGVIVLFEGVWPSSEFLNSAKNRVPIQHLTLSSF